MHTILKLTITAALTVLAAVSCHREELAPAQNPDRALKLTVTRPEFDITGTKAAMESDSIFAWPFDSRTETPVQPLRYDAYSDGQYYFTIPSGTESLLFTNVAGHESGITVLSPMPDALLEISCGPDSCIGHDICYGGIESYSEDSHEEAISLTRLVSRLRPALKIVVGEDTLSNLTDQFDSVSITFSGIHTGVTVGRDFSTVYTGSGQFTAPMTLTSASCASEGIYTFPGESTNPGITVHAYLKDGTCANFPGILPSPIEVNRDYAINIYLHKDNLEAGFTLGNIIMNDLYSDGAYSSDFDLVTLSEELLYFGVNEGDVNELIVSSRLGQWSAAIPAEALTYFRIENKRTGSPATSQTPTITGLSGDTLVFTTVNNISDREAPAFFEIPFKAEEHNIYGLTVIQSNGKTQEIEFMTDTDYYIDVEGYCNLYNEDNTLVANINTMGYEYSGIVQVTGGKTYRLSGDFIYSLDIYNPTYLKFNNCQSLVDLTLENIGIQEPDLSGLTALSTLTISNSNILNRLDLSGLSGLQVIEIANVSNLTEITAADGLPELRTISIENCPLLTTISSATSESPLLEEISLSDTPVTELDLSKATALRSFFARGSHLKELDFSNSPLLNDLYLSEDGYDPYTRKIILDNCQNISEVHFNYLDYLNTISLNNTAVGKFSIFVNDSLRKLDFSTGLVEDALLSNMSSLEYLNAENTDLKKLVIENTFKITDLLLRGCRQLAEYDVPNQSSLKNLDLRDCGLLSTPLELNYISEAESIRLSGCRSLRSFSMNSSDLTLLDSLDFTGCSSLETVTLEHSSSYTDRNNVAALIFDGCSSLKTVNIYGYGNLGTVSSEETAIQDMHLNGCAGLSILNLNGQSVKNLHIGDRAPWNDLIFLYTSSSGIETLSVNDMEGLTRVYADNCQALETVELLECENLYDIDLSNSGNVKTLHILSDSKSQLSSLEIGHLTELTDLQLENVVNIPRMDLTPNRKLQTLVLLKPLETSAVKYLNCSGLSELKSLDYGSAPDTLILDNCSSLEKLTVNGNKVRSVSITGMTGLKELTFQSVDMDTIILPDLPSLTDLSLINNYYTYELYAEGTYNVKRLTLTGNSLGFKACRMNFAQTLEELTITQTGYGDVSAYALDTIDFSNHARLTKADISGLGSHRDHSYHIDLSGCTSLPYVSIQAQGVTGIDLSGCSSLSIADLESCRDMTWLDVSECESLVGLDLYGSGLSAEALNEVFRQLPTRIPTDAALLRIVNSTGAGSCDLSIANDKEWTPTQMDISIPE